MTPSDRMAFVVTIQALSGCRSRLFPFAAQPHRAPVLFPANSGSKLSGMAMSMLLRRMGRDAITVHGFRSTFRDWAGESTSFPREVVEHAMAHQLADKAEAAYQRSTLLPKRVNLMAAWAAYCASPAAEGANVSRIRVVQTRSGNGGASS